MGPLQRAEITLLLCAGLLLEGVAPVYLPVTYRILNAEAAFFLQEANQDVMRNASLQARTEAFFIQQAWQTPVLAVSYGPRSLQQPLPPELLRAAPGPGSAATPPVLTPSWKLQAFIIRQRVHPSWPRVQVLFYLAGRRWGHDGGAAQLPCVALVAFHETQEVRGGCRLEGPLGLCVAQLQPLAAWFGPPSVRPGRQGVPELGRGTSVELYYLLQPPEEGGGACSLAASTQEQPRAGLAGQAPMQRIGSIRLLQPLVEQKLDQHFVVMVPSEAAGQGETLSAFLAAAAGASVQAFSLRVKMKEGVLFLGARASDPAAWAVSQDVRSEGHRVVTLHCQRKLNSFGGRTGAAGYQQVLQVDLEMNALLGPQWSQEVTWQLEYPPSQTVTPEVTTLIHLAQQHLGGIVALAMDTELLNTAVLTGRSVAVPVKVVAVAADGAVADVTESAECRATDEHVIKVSERCDFVYVDGSETRGSGRAVLNFTYSYLSAQLRVSVWAPRLPLRIQVSDPELNQIKGWRVPLSSTPHSDPGWSQRQGGCVAQYQSSALRVLTYFVADETGKPEGEEPEQHSYLLGSDWQVEVTQMVENWLRVEDPHLAQVDGPVLMGLRAGTTSVQVLSPLTSAVLAQTTIRVLDDRVSVTQLGVTLVSGLSLSLQLSPGSSRAIVATTTTHEVIESLEQESLISAWLQFSDGSLTPLDHYPPGRFTLTATSLEERVVQVQRSAAWKWPTVVAKGEGQGRLVRVELRPSEACHPEMLGGVLAVGTASIRVRLGEPERLSRRTASEPDAGPPERSATTSRDRNLPGTRPSTDSEPSAFSNHPNMAAVPCSRSSEDSPVPPRGPTTLEAGMFALLGVFCLAVLGFLVNCVSYAYKYHSKQLSLENPGMVSRDWVWLSQEEGLCLPGLLEEGQLLNGAESRANTGPTGRNDALNSPTTKRKRVKFTTFSKARSSSRCPGLGPLAPVQTSDIKWVCPDMEPGDPKGYLEKLHKELN